MEEPAYLKPSSDQLYVTNADLDNEIAQITSVKTNNTKLYNIPPRSEITKKRPGLQMMSRIRALGLIRHARLTQEMYIKLTQIFATNLGLEVFPKFEEVECVMKTCYPMNALVTNDKYYVALEDLAAHTTLRILEGHRDKIQPILNKFCTTLDTSYNEISMIVHMKDEESSLMGVYVCPMKLVYKGNSKGETAEQPVVLWESDCPKVEHSGRPHLLEFATPSKDYVQETMEDVEKETQQLSKESHCFQYEDKSMVRVSYSFEFSDTFRKIMADNATFSTGEMSEVERRAYLEGFSRERLEYTDPVVLECRLANRFRRN